MSNRVWVAVMLAAAAFQGCSTQRMVFLEGERLEKETTGKLMERFQAASHPADKDVTLASYDQALSVPFAAMPPLAPDDQQPVEYWDMSLDQAIQTALANSSVLRSLGARIIQAPALTPTIYGPSIVATDPRFGVEAALSAFDAQFSTKAFFEKNDRVLNNSLLGGGTNFFEQDLWRIQSELRKRAATGTEFSLRHNIEDDLNNATQNVFGTAGTINAPAWTWNIEAEIRQPLGQGGGVAFNRIAGPDATPGLANGVVIARVNTEMSAAEFQTALRNYLSNVENAYWELVFAYRDLDVKKEARDRTLKTWQYLKGRTDTATEDQLAQAAEQYFRFQQEVEVARVGRLLDGTRNFNGSTGGTFQGVGGVYVTERRLRLIMGLPVNGDRLIRPATEPPIARVVFEWDEVVRKSLTQRTELLRQRLRIRRRELELIASRNFLLPQFDVVGRYRRRALGDGLYDPHVPGSGFSPLGPSVNSGTDEWQVGLELSVPLGYRQANSGVRSAELNLARDRAVLTDMERQVVHGLSNALSNTSLAFKEVETSWNRRVAAKRQFTVLDVNKEKQEINYNILLDAERRLADAETEYHRARARYAVALKNIHIEMGALLEYFNIHLPDGGLHASS